MAGATRKSAFWRQTNTLATKNLTILLTRHTVSTLYTAILLPLILTVYLGAGVRLNDPNSEFGIGQPRPIRSLSAGLDAAGGSRDTVVFVNNGFDNGDITRVVEILSDEVSAAGKNATTVSDQSELARICRVSFRGTTSCYGAVIFHSSPGQGEGGIWNYTLRADGAFGSGFDVTKEDNDAQIYTLPLQRAVDSAIAQVDSGSEQASVLADTQEFPFTDATEEEREARMRREYQNAFIDYLGVALVLAFVGVSYHLPGHIATEREVGLSQLIDAMMPTAHDWEPQLARMLAALLSFSTVYLIGWVLAAVIARVLIWKETSIGITLVLFILGGLALTSQGIMGGTFFKKAQLSGNTNSLVFTLLAVMAQAIPDPGTGVVAVLSLLFTPCNLVFFIKDIARFKAEGRPMNLLKAAPNSASTLPGVVLWVFLILQFIIYPIIAAFLERLFHGVASDRRMLHYGETQTHDAVRIDGFTKVYQPSFFRRLFSFISKPRAPTVAVDNLNLAVQKGQIVALLGANGSGKSTTLDALAGISRFDHGSISVDASGGIGIAPQKNVLWDDLTVVEHIKLFNRLKSPHSPASDDEIDALIEAVGLTQKRKSRTATLSGGQKRKLQLGMMLTGGSAVCCVDEVSSGIDPLSRRKIWDILLSERGKRTIIMTTHFLDEADLLADNIVILSKGSLRAEGSAVALKNQLGAGYRVHVLNARNVVDCPQVHGVECEIQSNTITYVAPSSFLAAETIRALEAAGIAYRLSNPTIEDVFLKVADEANEENPQRPSLTNHNASAVSNDSEDQMASKKIKSRHATSTQLLSGQPIGPLKQTMVLVRKRFTLFTSNWIPFVVAFVLPILAAAITQILIRGESAAGCDPSTMGRLEDIDTYAERFDGAVFAAGPTTDFDGSSFTNLFGSLLPTLSSSDRNNISLELQDSFSGLETYIEENRRTVGPGGWWLGGDGTASTVAYRADKYSTYTAVIAQNLLNTMRTNSSIATAYVRFDSPVPSMTIDAFQVAIYFTIAVGVASAFFGLYPNVERRTNVRSLQYSSGVRSVPLWASHLAFDYGIFVVALILAAIIFATSSDIWYSGGYLFPVFILYGLTSVLLSYVFSLVLKSQLGTFAAIMAYNSVGLAIYLIAFLFILSLSPESAADRNVLLAHYIISVFFPTASLLRAFLVGLNLFSTACSGDDYYSYAGTMNAYGGPILYLALQAVLLFGILFWNDSGNKLPGFLTSKKKTSSAAQPMHSDGEAGIELVHVRSESGEEGLRVKHLTKSFGKFTAVDNVSFEVNHGEVFALLGPNGAGKSTTISLIRGDIQPSRNGGDVFVEGTSANQQRALARAHLGVCPQFDALDSMTVLDHLRHYARIRGISDVEHQVNAVVHAVGLQAHVNTLAQHLSGGNKRKLSLGMALTGNPSVILLDEPSSGLDAAAKRIMWRTLTGIVPGRSILLTTHSMEEADALANRAGILAQRMLAMDEVESLRQQFGDSLYVHLVSRTAPHSSSQEMEHMRSRLLQMFPTAQIEPDTYHGQMRFSVPAAAVLERSRAMNRDNVDREGHAVAQSGHTTDDNSAIGKLIRMLEEEKETLGIEHHSVSPTTLNDVFLAIVGQHNVAEEGYGPKPRQEQQIAAGGGATAAPAAAPAPTRPAARGPAKDKPFYKTRKFWIGF